MRISAVIIKSCIEHLMVVYFAKRKYGHFCSVTKRDLPLCFLLQILEKIVENPSNRICADCGMKGKTRRKVNFHFIGQTRGLIKVNKNLVAIQMSC